MEMKDLQIGMNRLLGLRLANAPAVTAGIFSAYFLAIGDLQAAQLVEAIERIAKNGTESGFFPSAPELRKLCINELEVDSSSQWMRFKKLCTAYQKSEALKLSEDDYAMNYCIKSYYDDYGSSSPSSATFWIDIFKKTYSASKITEKQMRSTKIEEGGEGLRDLIETFANNKKL